MVDELHNYDDESDSDGDDLSGKYVYFDSNNNMQRPIFKMEIRFTGREEFKDVKNYCINKGKVCRFRPSELKRVRAVCRTKECKCIFSYIESLT